MASAGWSDPRRQGCQRPRRSSATPTARSPAAVQQARAASLCHALCLRSSEHQAAARDASALSKIEPPSPLEVAHLRITMRERSFERPGQRAKKCVRRRFALDALGAQTTPISADRRTLASRCASAPR